MSVEIERKFLVKGDFTKMATRKENIRQAYLSVDPDRIVRIRITGERGFLTVKSLSFQDLLSRNEWEYEIPVNDADDILKICLPSLLEKTRYLVPAGNHFFEVDEFHGKHEGLVIAEIELKSEDEDFERPEWLGKEVTGDPFFYNSNLSK